MHQQKWVWISQHNKKFSIKFTFYNRVKVVIYRNDVKNCCERGNSNFLSSQVRINSFPLNLIYRTILQFPFRVKFKTTRRTRKPTTQGFHNWAANNRRKISANIFCRHFLSSFPFFSLTESEPRRLCSYHSCLLAMK